MRKIRVSELVPSAKLGKRDPKQGGQNDKRIWRIPQGIVLRQRRKTECAQNGGLRTCAQREIGKMLLVILIRATPPIFAPIPLGYHTILLIDGKKFVFMRYWMLNTAPFWNMTPRSCWHPIFGKIACSHSSFTINKPQLEVKVWSLSAIQIQLTDNNCTSTATQQSHSAKPQATSYSNCHQHLHHQLRTGPSWSQSLQTAANSNRTLVRYVV